MKKLNKLEINPKKLMKNEELLNLRGGYEGGGWCGYMYVDCPWGAWSGPACGESPEAAEQVCGNLWGPEGCTCNAY
jgi:hypothetical protein